MIMAYLMLCRAMLDVSVYLFYILLLPYPGREVDFESFYDIHIPAVIMKSFLRQLPEPLLTFDLYDHIIHVQCAYAYFFSITDHSLIKLLVYLKCTETSV